MAYSEEWFDRMETCPQMQRQYFWTCAMHAKARAASLREAVRKDRQVCPEMGCGLVDLADWMERFGDAVLMNIDALVESCRPTPSKGERDE